MKESSAIKNGNETPKGDKLLEKEIKELIRYEDSDDYFDEEGSEDVEGNRK